MIKPLILLFCLLFSVGLKSQTSNEYTPFSNAFGSKNEHINNFTGDIYYLPEYTTKLPNFKKLTSVGKIYTSTLYIKEQNFRNGFPGVSNRNEFFAIDYNGEFYLKDSSLFCFMLCSDDGSKLFIDGKLIINNDYLHKMSCKTNVTRLKQGTHKINVQYFQGPKFSVGLMLQYKKCDEESYRPFDLAEFYPLSINTIDSAINISIGDEILFEYDRYDLNDVAKKALSDIKRLIIDKSIFQSIIIEGHTDDMGSDAYNMKLSLNRARVVMEYFVNIGVDSKLILVKGYGETKPKVPNVDNESRKINRRIEITIK